MGPRVPPLEPARAIVWIALAVAALAPLATPADPGPWVTVGDAEGCRLDRPGRGPDCDCAAFPAALRIALGLPLPLDRATEADLQRVPGLGPARARAIVAERERGGPFGRVADLARVAGIGPLTAERLRPHLFAGGPDPACD